MSVRPAPALHAARPAVFAWEDLAIVIVSYNTLGLLQRCVEHLLALGAPARRITVVDNGSSDGSAQWLCGQTANGLNALTLERNLGFAGGNNVGICHTDGGWVLLLNSDAFPEPGSLQTLVTALAAHPNAAIAGPQLLFEDGRWQRSGGALPSPASARAEALGLPSLGRVLQAAMWPVAGRWRRTRSVGYVDGACMLIRRDVLLEVGLLDDGYFFFAEDAELCERVQRAGYAVILAPQARVRHLRGASSARKDSLSSQRMKRDALRRYVTHSVGEAGWRDYARWTQRNFRWRAGLCRMASRLIPSIRPRCEVYEQIATLYGGEAGMETAQL